MKRNARWAGFAALGSGLMGAGAWGGPLQPLPTPFPEARYEQMTARSPFAVATAAVAAAATTPDFAAQLYVTGVAQVGNTDYVAIKTRDPQEGKPAEVFVEVGETTADGIRVERVTWSDQTGKSTVDVTKGGEKATLKFDEAEMEKNGGVAGAAMPGQPGMPGNANGDENQPLRGTPQMRAALRRQLFLQTGH